jgi:hypothetical protein
MLRKKYLTHPWTTPICVSRTRRMMILDAPIENQRTDQEDSIINKMLNLSKVQDHTLSKSKKLVIATQYIPFDLDD